MGSWMSNSFDVDISENPTFNYLLLESYIFQEKKNCNEKQKAVSLLSIYYGILGSIPNMKIILKKQSEQ